MKSIERMIDTEWRNVPGTKGREKIRAKYGFHYLKGNSRPYFSITADIVSRDRMPGEPTYQIDGKTFWFCGGGCCHEDIARVFPELSALIPWHLVDDDGEPMHYKANSIYHLENALGVAKFKCDYPNSTPMDAFKNTMVFGSVDGDAERLAEILETPEPEPEDIPDLADFERREKAIIRIASEWLEERKPALARRMRETMEAFRVAYIQEHEYRSDGASL